MVTERGFLARGFSDMTTSSGTRVARAQYEIL